MCNFIFHNVYDWLYYKKIYTVYEVKVVKKMDGVSVTNLLSGVQSGMMEQIGSALPIAGVVFGAIAGIMIGIKIFKRITGARS